MNHLPYINKSSMAGNQLLYCVNRAGCGFVNETFHIERNAAYPYSVLHFVKEGKGGIAVRGKDYPIGPGQLFVLNAYEAHRYWTDAKNALFLNWVEFSGGDSASLISAYLEQCPAVLEAPGSQRVNDCICEIVAYLKKEGERDSYLLSQRIYGMLLELLKAGNSGIAAADAAQGAVFLRKVLGYIDHHLHEELSIRRLANISNFNPTYFAKLFRERVGTTPARYILDRRIGKARVELAEKNDPVEWLAEQLGFCNASHFIRLFKKSEGLTPSEYRRQSRLYRQSKE